MSTQQTLKDSEILKSSKNSPWMFGMLVDRYQKAFLRKSISILHSKDLSEDAVQDTFIKIYKNLDKFSLKENASFSSWAYKILTNTCYSHASKKALSLGRVKNVEFEDLDAMSNSRDLEDKSRISLVSSILGRLPLRLSRLLSLYFFEERSYGEIAEIENISLSAVKSGLHRAKKQFKAIAVEIN